MWAKIWEVLTWVPEPVDLGESISGIRESFLAWVANQISNTIGLLGELLLSFPVSFVTAPIFLSLYRLILTGTVIFIPIMALYKIYCIAGGWITFKLEEALITKIILASILVGFVPTIFYQMAYAANAVTKGLLKNIKFNIIDTVDPEMLIIVLVIILFVASIRLILYYAVRNVHMIVLVLQAPIILLKWVFGGEIKAYLSQVGGLLIVQIIHAILLYLMVQLVHADGTEEKLARAWTVMVQIGCLELMLRTQELTKHILPFEGVDTSRITSMLRRIKNVGRH